MGAPGTYVLALRIEGDPTVTVGRLGQITFEAGRYYYVGSALGPGGLTARLARHLTRAKRPHWHIDYLLQHATVVEIWSRESTERLECLWTAALLRLPGVQAAVAGFGSSDCRCSTHLLYLDGGVSVRILPRCLRQLEADLWWRLRPRAGQCAKARGDVAL